MKLTRLKRHYGNPVTGDYFWPRPDITEPIVGSLLAGESIKLFGLRRTGKSSVMLEVERALTVARRTVVYVDVQGNDRVDNLVAKLIQALPKSDAGSKIASALSSSRVHKGIAVVQDLFRKTPPEPPSPTAILHRIELVKGDLTALMAQQNGSVVLLIDELPFLIGNMLDRGLMPADVNAFLATLRAWRQDGRVPMLLSGSIGLTWLMRERGIAREHFNDLVANITPPPLQDADARAMLKALALEEDCPWMTDDLISVVVAESAVNYPSFLQFAFGRLKDHKARTAEDVRRIFEQHIRQSLDEDFYAQFSTRMNRLDDADRAAARTILRIVDNAGEQPAHFRDIDQALVSHPDCDHDDLLVTLVEDGFLTIDTRAQTAVFGSPLVRTWWQSKPYRR